MVVRDLFCGYLMCVFGFVRYSVMYERLPIGGIVFICDASTGDYGIVFLQATSTTCFGTWSLGGPPVLGLSSQVEVWLGALPVRWKIG